MTLAGAGDVRFTASRRSTSPRGLYVLAGSLLLFLSAVASWLLGTLTQGLAPKVALGASTVLLLGCLGAVAADGSVRAVARYTFTQCLRTKVAGVFIVLLALMVGTMPFVMKGDGTLAGRIRTFLAYSTGITALLLSLVTIFLAAGLISGDVRTKQVFSLASKPLARWQYIVGRWLGVVWLDAVLLAAGGAAIYAEAQYLRGRSDLLLNPNDHRAVETEIFTARAKVAPESLEERIKAGVQERIARLQQEGAFRRTLDAFKEKARGDETEALAMMEEEIRKQVSEKLQSAAPGRPLTWNFSDIRVGGSEITSTARVVELPPGKNIVRLQARASLVAHLVYKGPVRVNGVEARVASLGKDFFDAWFAAADMNRPDVKNLGVDQRIPVVIDPLIQITYKAAPGSPVRDDTLQSLWQVTNPTTGLCYTEQRSDPARMAVTLTASARVVDAKGQTQATYFNLPVNNTSVTILNQDVAVLYRVGSFEWNFLRSCLLMLVQLMFLAALATFAGSFASFPVACLVSFAVLPFSLARGFLTDAVRISAAAAAEGRWFTYVAHYVFKVMTMLLPDFGRTLPGDRLVDGLYIPWTDLGETAGLTIGVQALLGLALACLIFHKRELARVQV